MNPPDYDVRRLTAAGRDTLLNLADREPRQSVREKLRELAYAVTELRRREIADLIVNAVAAPPAAGRAG